jgi:hypothetical protein
MGILPHVPITSHEDSTRNFEVLGELLPESEDELQALQETLEALIAKPQWVEPALENSWKTVAGTTPAGYTKDALGFVHLRGRIESGVSGKQAFLLPAGFRPAGNDTYAASVFAGATAGSGLVNALAEGEVLVFVNGAFENVGLGGINWLAEN